MFFCPSLGLISFALLEFREEGFSRQMYLPSLTHCTRGSHQRLVVPRAARAKAVDPQPSAILLRTRFAASEAMMVSRILVILTLLCCFVIPSQAVEDWDTPDPNVDYMTVKVWHPAEEGFQFIQQIDGVWHSLYITNGVPIHFKWDTTMPLPQISTSVVGAQAVFDLTLTQSQGNGHCCEDVDCRTVDRGPGTFWNPATGKEEFGCWASIGACQECTLKCLEADVCPSHNGNALNFDLQSPNFW